MMLMIMIRMMVATEERKGKVGGLPAEEEQLPPEGDNSGRSSNTYFLSSSRLRQTTQNYKKMFKIDDLDAAILTNSDAILKLKFPLPKMHTTQNRLKVLSHHSLANLSSSVL